MKITIESYGKQHSTLVDHDDLTIVEYIDIFYALLVANGFQTRTIKEGFEDFIEEKKI